MNDFNCAVICGKVESGPALVEVGDVEKKPYTRLKLLVCRKKAKGMDFKRFDIRAYGETGAEMMQRVKTGDRIMVVGPVSTYGYIGDDKKVYAVPLIYVTKWMPDQIKKEMDALEDTALNGRKKNEPDWDGYGDNMEMLFGGQA